MFSSLGQFGPTTVPAATKPPPPGSTVFAGTLRSGPQGRASKGGQQSRCCEPAFPRFVRGPSFETAATRPPQDEVVARNIVKVSAYERATPWRSWVL